MRLPTFALLLFFSLTFSAPAATQVTNDNQADSGVVFANQSNSIAQAFITGPGNPWTLRSVGLHINYTGIGFTTIIIRLRDYTPGFGPGGFLENLAVYQIGFGSYDLNLFSSGTVLQPNTRYYISADTIGNPVEVRVTEDNAECSVTGWTIEDYGNAQSFSFWPAWGTTSVRLAIDADPIIPAPIVTSVSGCTDTPPTTVGCPNSGGVNLQVMGQNFTSGTVILIGGIPAANPVFVSSTQIHCVLPPGAGRKHPVTAVDASAVGVLGGGVSYVLAACPGDANNDGMVNFQDIAATLAAFNAVCP